MTEAQATFANPTSLLTDNNPLPPEILHAMEKQATINIGTLGHVSHGKTTLVEAITGIKTIKHSTEKGRNITIRLGYANFKLFRCEKCPEPQCFRSYRSRFTGGPCPACNTPLHLLRHFSFVDCPGHDCLMATMLSGAAVMDAALLIVSGTASCPQPQTVEHLVAAEIMDLKNVTIVQTKLDLINMEKAKENHTQIQQFVKGTVAQNSPIVPVASMSGIRKQKQADAQSISNVDVLLQHLYETVPVPSRDLTSPALMTIVRSFDVNTPGTDYSQLKGGVAGGTLQRGTLTVGQMVEIRPGLVKKGKDGTVQCRPMVTCVMSLFSEENSLKYAVPGGLIAVGTKLDPAITKSDRLAGQVLGAVGTLPPVFLDMEIKYSLMKRVVGLTEGEKAQAPEKAKIHRISKGEVLMLNVGSSMAKGHVTAVNKTGGSIKVSLLSPCCVDIGARVSLSRKYESSWRLIGCGTIVHGVPLALEQPTLVRPLPTSTSVVNNDNNNAVTINA